MIIRIASGRPDPAETAAIVAAVDAVVVDGGRQTPPAVADAWALLGRLDNLQWQPLQERWPGEPTGRRWRRAASTGGG